MAVVVLIGCWSLAAALVLYLVQRYCHLKSLPPLVLLAVFLSWLLPFSLIFLLPIDISSTRYEQCLLAGGSADVCSMSILYVGAPVRRFSWLIVYWTTFMLTW